MVSPYGRRGAICKYFHWTWDYLHHGIGWATVQRMMVDQPSYNFDERKRGGVHVALTTDEGIGMLEREIKAFE